MPEERLNGYWEKKNDPADFIHVDRVLNTGLIQCTQYYEGKGQAKIVITPLKITQEELKKNYQRRV